MKRNIILLTVVAALSAVSCNKTEKLDASIVITPNVTEITLDENYEPPQPLDFKVRCGDLWGVSCMSTQNWCTIEF